jgi:quercetin dioxygenase-like cupin family protein
MRLTSLVLPLIVLAGTPELANRQTGQSAPHTGAADRPGTPLILHKEDGERRVRRRPPTAAKALDVPFIIKVDARNGGSPNFFLGYEDIPPGLGIPRHYHPTMDEILFIHRGQGLASLGSRQAVVAEGATIYIPAHTRVSLANTGTEPLSILFLFPQPEMASYFRDASVAEGEKADPFSEEEFSAFRQRHRHHIVFEDR